MKKKLVMLAAHVPSIDPRVIWEAESAAEKFNVELVGVADSKKEEKSIRWVTQVGLNINENRNKVFFSFLLWMVRKNIFLLLPSLCYLSLRGVHKLCVFAVHLQDRLRSLSQVMFGRHKIDSSVASLLQANQNDVQNSEESRLKEFIKMRLLRNHEKSIVADILVHYWLAHHLFKFSVSCIDYFNCNIDDVDIIHCNDFDTVPVGLYFKDKYGCSVVYDAHEFWPFSLTKRPKSQGRLLKLLESIFIGHVDEVLTVSPNLAKEIAASYKLQNVSCILNAEPWREKEYRDQLNDKLVFLYQGNFAPDRGVEELVDAWSRLRPANAILQLRGPESEAKDNLVQCVNSLGVDSIQFPEAVSEEQLVDAAKSADIGIIPYKPINTNYRYCCPNKLSQYMHAGLVILANDLVFVSWVVEEYDVGFIYKNEDVDGLAKVIQTIIDNRSDVLKKRGNVINTARNVFNWQAEEKKLMSIYMSVAR